MEERNQKRERDPLVVLCNVLHTFGVGSKEVEIYKEKFKDDEAFQRRAIVLERLIKSCAEVNDALGEDDTLPPVV